MSEEPRPPSLRERLHEFIFEADTPSGKLFDVTLLALIIASVLAAVLETVEAIRTDLRTLLYVLEWCFTIIFTIEYALRLYCVRKPLRYAFSFYGIVDLLAVLPTYLSLFITGAQSLIVIRALRLLRVFRVLKMARFLNEAGHLNEAMRASRHKIVVFLMTVLTVVVIVGAMMYLIEGPENGFTSIPKSIYWAIVTMTTVGYGDIRPLTPTGQTLASLVMVVGYGIIAVPTGIVTAELTRVERKRDISTQACRSCSREGHATDAVHCKYCGAEL